MGINDVVRRIQPSRRIEGISAVLLPFDSDGKIDFPGFQENVRRTLDAGLAPAVNMDTGYVNLLMPQQRSDVLKAAREVCEGKKFVAGVFADAAEPDLPTCYTRLVAEVMAAGAMPILFQRAEFKEMSRDELVGFHRRIAEGCPAFLCFELGEMFASFGRIYDLPTVRELMRIPQIKGMKHSSLDREREWQRLALRDEVRPDFKIYTGNDLAIDMVMYGSDYLLGLSAFAPEAFAARDRLWTRGDPRFFDLNDTLQYLGAFAFRPPVPAYKHSAAQFLQLRGKLASDAPHPKGQRRPDSDIEILARISEKLDALMVSL
ncbi:MAG TPA: dihydrodipicolinate synthase family protein [Verrucomicrobiae bacterium]|nr:dihydrodipicolinate synthase family protein [Verrucomicrobiae bacterium]